jgi:hypothetical protein
MSFTSNLLELNNHSINLNQEFILNKIKNPYFMKAKELTPEQQAVVKDFFEEFKTSAEQTEFLKGLKANVLVKHFPMILLIGKEKTGLYHTTDKLAHAIASTLASRDNPLNFNIVCYYDPEKVDEELEAIKAKYADA